MKKKTLLGTSLSFIVTLALMLAFGGMTVFADDEQPSGTCGTDLVWELDTSGTLTISGEGDMDDYGDPDEIPWNDYMGSITKVIIEDGVENIGCYAFYGCGNLSEVEFSESVVYIGEESFSDCISISEITIPESVLEIGEHAFYNCENLESLNIQGGVKVIGWGAFDSCYALKEVVLPQSLTTICDAAFDHCNKIESIELPENLTYIGNYAFAHGGFKSIVIPGKVSYIGKYAFGCGDLESVTLENGVAVIGEDAFSSNKITSITIPGSVEVIGKYAFDYCTDLTTLVILNGADKICERAFSNCWSLTTVTIPASVRYIYSDAFKGCRNLTEIYCYADPSSIDVSAFDTGSSNIKVYVKKEYLQQYQSKFSSIDGIEFVSIVDMDLGVHLYGYTVSLDGAIGVNFSMRLSDELLASDTAKMVFTVTSLDGTNTRTVEIPVSSLVEGKTKTGNDCIFKCNVVAKEMTSTITAQMVDGDQEGKVYTYSVQKYAQYIIENPSKFPVESVGIVKAMLNYGACAQTYFGYNTEKLANSILPADEQVIPDVSASMIDVDALNAKGSTIPSKVSLSLESTVTLKLSFETALLPEDVEFYDENGGILTTEISGEYTVVLIKGIPVQDLDKPVKIYVSDGSEIAYCPLRYCRAVLANTSNPAYTADLKKLVAALYLYNESTKYGN